MQSIVRRLWWFLLVINLTTFGGLLRGICNIPEPEHYQKPHGESRIKSCLTCSGTPIGLPLHFRAILIAVLPLFFLAILRVPADHFAQKYMVDVTRNSLKQGHNISWFHEEFKIYLLISCLPYAAYCVAYSEIPCFNVTAKKAVTGGITAVHTSQHVQLQYSLPGSPHGSPIRQQVVQQTQYFQTHQTSPQQIKMSF